MDAHTPDARFEDLLGDTAWLRALALRLVRDADVADDLVQDTLLRALERPPERDPEGERSLRPWLGRVLGNLLRSRRRRERPTTPADVESVSDASTDVSDELAAFEQQRFLVDAVDELPEPYRSAVVQRYFGGRRSADIAREAGLSPATVRWRVHEGLERLRQRFDAKEDGDRRAWCLALLSFANTPARQAAPAAAAPAAAPVAVMGAGILGGMAMHATWKAAALGTAVAALLLTGYRAWDPGPAEADPPRAPGSTARLAAPPARVSPAAPSETPDLRSPSPRAGPDRADVHAADAAPLSAVQDGGSAEAEWGELVLRFTDAFGSAVPMTRVRPVALGALEQTVDSFAWPGAAHEWVSDSAGELRVRYPRSLGEGQRTGSARFAARHPDFLPREFAVAATGDGDAPVHTIELVRGGLVALSGWIAEPSERIVDVSPRLSRSARVQPDWAPLRDGRPATADLSPGPHTIVLGHVDREGRAYFSEPSVLSVVEGQSHDVHLRLLPTHSLRGRVGDEVPRPVRGGFVLANLAVPNDAHELRLDRRFRADLAPDGTFELVDLPRAAGQIVAACEGWISTLDRSGADPRPPSFGREAFEGPGLVLAMEPTSELALTLTDAGGAPVAGATVVATPMVHWASGSGQMLFGRALEATTDLSGFVELSDLPPGLQTFRVQHPRFALPKIEDRLGRTYRRLDLDLEPGQRRLHAQRLETEE